METVLWFVGIALVLWLLGKCGMGNMDGGFRF